MLRFISAPASYCLPEWWPDAVRRAVSASGASLGAIGLEACSATILRRCGLDGACDEAMRGAARAAVLSKDDLDRLLLMLGIVRQRRLVLRTIDAAVLRDLQGALAPITVRDVVALASGAAADVDGDSAWPVAGRSVAWLRQEGVRTLGEAAAGWGRDVRIRTALRVPRSGARGWTRTRRSVSMQASDTVEACLEHVEAPLWL
ncbi:MAG: hypothetical protein RJA99_3920 [Pseudomonadota bacterium]|jgi:hypothetical protein